MNAQTNLPAGSGCSSHDLFSDLRSPWKAVDGDYDSIDVHDADGGFVCSPCGDTIGQVATRAGVIADAPQTLADLNKLRDAVRNLRNVQGRHHTQIATELLFALLPENAGLWHRRRRCPIPRTTLPAVDHQPLVL